MPLRLFHERTGWSAARSELLYTTAALEAREPHRPLAKPLHTLLESWKAIDTERRAAEDAMVAANAAVAAIDAELDEVVSALSRELVHAAKGDRRDRAYVAFFPDGANTIVRLGLESELERVKSFGVLAKELAIAEAARSKIATLEALAPRGRAALEARQQRAVALALVRLRITEWKEAANAARRGVELALGQYAVAHKKGKTYPDPFFPLKKRSKREAEGSGEEDAPSPE